MSGSGAPLRARADFTLALPPTMHKAAAALSTRPDADPMTHYLVFPFETRRTSTASGPVARQTATLLADALAHAGHTASVRQWFARNNQSVAWVLAEGPLPASTVRAEVAAAGASLAIVGRVLQTDDGWALNVACVEPIQQHIAWSAEAGPAPLHRAFQRILEACSEAIGHPLAPAVTTRSDAAFIALCADRDLQAWMKESGSPATDRADEYRSLLTLLRDDDAEEWATNELLRRASAWSDAGDMELTLRATTDALELSPQCDPLWSLALQSAESMPRDQSEYWLKRILTACPERHETRLRLGVALLRNGRHDEAMPLLQRAADDDALRDAADTYLGVALASTGKVEQAVITWKRIIAESDDSQLRRIAQENLARVSAE